MKYGFVLPYADPRTAVELACEAEDAGWDGFFTWEPVWGWEAWVVLGAAAVRTQRIKLGTMITPLSRMRPWKLAGETVTVDHLSQGRVILSVGLGAVDTGFAAFGEATDRKVRAERLDEGLAILAGLWGGQPFRYTGKHYTVQPVDFFPPPSPVQQPRIPIWVVGALGSPKSMARALRYDGLIPSIVSVGSDGQKATRQVTPNELREAVAYVKGERTATTPFAFVVEGETFGMAQPAAAKVVAEWADAGATWWMETLWTKAAESATPAEGIALLRERIKQGAPRKN
ncbi:MAG TPA: LLM class flavin-dependent oxidoreductase [Aggregatilineales bacterium]|nr:LLM class flavin-dependent oxidoreductase [Anaerolineales bacterium]HRE48363.1 LLM class flavin-dependent oxidoreductase [Aggregatilineales bacterium]